MTVDQSTGATLLLFILLMAAFVIGAVVLNSMVSPESEAANSPIVEETCITCHTRFGITRQFMDERRKSRR